METSKEEMEKYSQVLEKMVEERTAELERKVKEAERQRNELPRRKQRGINNGSLISLTPQATGNITLSD